MREHKVNGIAPSSMAPRRNSRLKPVGTAVLKAVPLSCKCGGNVKLNER